MLSGTELHDHGTSWHMLQRFGQLCTAWATPHAGVGGNQEEVLGRISYEEGFLENPRTCCTKATQVAPRGLPRPQLLLSHPLLDSSRTCGGTNTAIAHVPPRTPTVSMERRRTAGLLPVRPSDATASAKRPASRDVTMCWSQRSGDGQATLPASQFATRDAF